jgi:apolipoprotein N-acyltransferase
MERLKGVLSFAVGLAVLLAFMFGLMWLVMRFGLVFIIGAYVVMFLALLAGFLIFAPGLVQKPPEKK